MIQNKKRIISLILMLTLLVSSLVVGAITASAAETGDKFVKVTSAPSDWSGTYLIVYESGKYAFNGDLSALDATKNMQSVEISNGEIASSDALKKMTFTIAKSGNNYTIKSASGYYIGQTSNANGLKSSKTTTYANTITINNDGSVNFVSGGAYLRFNSASDQMRFRYYKSSSYAGQKAICLYKLVEGTTSENPVCNHENAIKTDATPATCVNPGNNVYYTCECGTFLDGSKAVVNEGSWVIPALGHTGGSATCDKLAVCERCEQGYGVFADHTYVNNVCVDCGALKPNNSTITFDNTDKRVVFTGDTQVWKEDGITVTNNQATSTSEMADYSNPVRFYKSTELIVKFDGMIKMEFTCSSAAYATSLATSIGDGAIVNDAVVTVVLTKAVNEYTIKLSDGQVRMHSVKVYACTHSWQDATCTAPKTCSVCGATEGEALGHKWSDATCTAPKTCSTCKTTEGEALGHDWDDATCTAPKTCACGATEGEALGHNYIDGKCNRDNCDAVVQGLVINAENKTATFGQAVTIEGNIVFSGATKITINADVTVVNGGVVTFDSDAEFYGTGKLYVAKDKFVYVGEGEAEGGTLPVWNSTSAEDATVGYYSFYTINTQTLDKVIENEDGSVTVVFRPTLNKDAEVNASVFGGGAIDNAISFRLEIYAEGKDAPVLSTSISEETIKAAYGGETPKAITVTIRGAKEGVKYTVKLVVVSETGRVNTTVVGTF